MPLLTVEVVRASNLAADSGRNRENREDDDFDDIVNPFIQLTVGQIIRRTKTAEDNDSPEFHEEFAFYVDSPAKNKLIIEAFDELTETDAHMMARHTFGLDKLEKGKRIETWVQLDGGGSVLIRVRALDFGLPSAESEDQLYSDATKKQVVVVLQKGSKLPPTTKAGACNCYSKVSLGNVTKQSALKEGSAEPVWNEAFLFTVFDETTQVAQVELLHASTYNPNASSTSATESSPPKNSKNKNTGVLGRCAIHINNIYRGKANAHWYSLMLYEAATGAWKPADQSRLRIMLCPIGYGKTEEATSQPKTERFTLERRQTASNLQSLKGYGLPPFSNDQTADIVDIEVVEAFGGRFSNTTGLKPVVRMTVAGIQQQTVAPQIGLQHPVWKEVFQFPLRDIRKDKVYVELLSDGNLLGECTVQLLQVSHEVMNLYIVMMYDEAKGEDGEDPPKVHLKVRAKGPNIPMTAAQRRLGDPLFPPAERAPPNAAAKPKPATKPSSNSGASPLPSPRVRLPPPDPAPPQPISPPPENDSKDYDESRLADWTPPPSNPSPVPAPPPRPPPPRNDPPLKEPQPPRKMKTTGTDPIPDKKRGRRGRRRFSTDLDDDEFGDADDEDEVDPNQWYHLPNYSDDGGPITAEEMLQMEDWRLKLAGVPTSETEMIWLRVLTYLVGTERPLNRREYRMLRSTHETLFARKGNNKAALTSMELAAIEASLRRWAAQREQSTPGDSALYMAAHRPVGPFSYAPRETNGPPPFAPRIPLTGGGFPFSSVGFPQIFPAIQPGPAVGPTTSYQPAVQQQQQASGGPGLYGFLRPMPPPAPALPAAQQSSSHSTIVQSQPNLSISMGSPGAYAAAYYPSPPVQNVSYYPQRLANNIPVPPALPSANSVERAPRPAPRSEQINTGYGIANPPNVSYLSRPPAYPLPPHVRYLPQNPPPCFSPPARSPPDTKKAETISWVGYRPNGTSHIQHERLEEEPGMAAQGDQERGKPSGKVTHLLPVEVLDGRMYPVMPPTFYNRN